MMYKSHICMYFLFSFPTTMTLQLQLTETTLFYWNSAFDLLNLRAHNLKKDYSGLQLAMLVQNWMAALTAAPSQHTTESSLASSRHPATTDASTNFSSLLRLGLPLATSSSGGLGYRITDYEASDRLYCDTVMNPPKHCWRDPSAVSGDTCSGAGHSHVKLQPGHP
jgi:hypothetical protein